MFNFVEHLNETQFIYWSTVYKKSIHRLQQQKREEPKAIKPGLKLPSQIYSNYLS